MSMLENISSIKDGQCIVDALLRELDANECRKCGKCVFGYEGLTQLEMILRDISNRKGQSGDMELMRELCAAMTVQSLCEYGEDIGRAVLHALEANREELEEHVSKKACRAGVCKKFMTYHILADKCVGCGDCLDACGEDAILGKNRFVHVIDQDECTQCGACLDACEEEAIVRAGAMKPRCPKKPIPCKAR